MAVRYFFRFASFEGFWRFCILVPAMLAGAATNSRDGRPCCCSMGSANRPSAIPGWTMTCRDRRRPLRHETPSPPRTRLTGVPYQKLERDRKRVVEGKRVAGRGDHGGTGRITKKQKKHKINRE